ncbi:glycosyltransferase [Rheinheimera sp. 1928-s]|uniref:glycosyltransferase n=1 Tax=Rheinheimera sp. 1928-s TaxID=3033803 RepID=UPI0026075D50|nr:glycosyltransferase [Rheinheimera sp. 1928-s]MDF3125698.1 glycosyltransferase [Rheinheimera sp. 1928-s]
MKALVVFDGRFYDNHGIPSSYHLNYELFAKRYLNEFDTVTIVGRLFNHPDDGAQSVIGKNASFVGVPGYVGPKSFLFKMPIILKLLWSIDLHDTAVFLRTPGTIPFIFSIILLLKRKIFAVEVVADPHDQLSKGAVKHPIRIFFQKLYSSFLKWQCKRAIGAAYVTKSALQKRYPPGSDLTTNYTSLNLGNEWFVEKSRVYDKLTSVHLLNIGMMVQLYKAQDVILEMVSILKKRNFLCFVTFVGDGEYKEFLEKLAVDLDVSDQVKFVGKISDRTSIRKYYDEAEIFLLPSRQEGLPRVMIEAMSRALPCVGTNVGGVSELLDSNFIVEVDNAEALASKVEYLCSNPEVMELQSKKNLITSQDYKGEIVQKRREAFYKAVRERNHEA